MNVIVQIKKNDFFNHTFITILNKMDFVDAYERRDKKISSKEDEILFLLNKLQNNPEVECCICTSNTTDHLFLCDHGVHVNCMVEWVKASRKYECPTCKASMKNTAYSEVHKLVTKPPRVIMSADERKMFADFKYQFCPECDFVVEYYAGCTHLKCPNCQTYFDANIRLPLRNQMSLGEALFLGIAVLIAISLIPAFISSVGVKNISDWHACHNLSKKELSEISFYDLHQLNNMAQNTNVQISELEYMIKNRMKETKILLKFFNISSCEKLMIEKPIGRYSLVDNTKK